jgi:hypothetical protein
VIASRMSSSSLELSALRISAACFVRKLASASMSGWLGSASPAVPRHVICGLRQTAPGHIRAGTCLCRTCLRSSMLQQYSECGLQHPAKYEDHSCCLGTAVGTHR